MGLHDQYYGKGAEPANNNEQIPYVSPEHVKMSGGIAEMRKLLGMPDPEFALDILAMRIEGHLEHIASSNRCTPIPTRKFTSEIGDGDEN
jgi:hypothetical protein